MARTKIYEIAHLVRQGWRPYNEVPESKVYERINCAHPPNPEKKSHKPTWFVRGDIFLCLGCSRRCSLSRPEGFIMPLPIKYNYNSERPFSLTPMEMVKAKYLLNVAEAAYCLNVSERTIYAWIACGRLRAIKEGPKRVSAKDVEQEMNDFDE